MKFSRSAPAKVNLLLHVGFRSVEGRHALASVVVPLKIADSVNFTRTDADLSFNCHCSEELVLHHGSERLLELSSESNLAFRAAKAFFSKIEKRAVGSLSVLKRIPLEAGLGGGSSDAAATLLLLNEAYEFPLTLDELRVLGIALGSDVPIFLLESPALVRGFGGEISKFNFNARESSLLLLKPPTGVSTALAFKSLKRAAGDGLSPESQQDFENRVQGLNRDFITSLHNDFQAPLEAETWFQEGTQALKDAGAEAVLLCGSGSTLCGIFRPAALVKFSEKVSELISKKWWLEKTEFLL